MAIYQLFGVFPRIMVINAYEFDPALAAVWTNQNAIWHSAAPLDGGSAILSVTDECRGRCGDNVKVMPLLANVSAAPRCAWTKLSIFIVKNAKAQRFKALG